MRGSLTRSGRIVTISIILLLIYSLIPNKELEVKIQDDITSMKETPKPGTLRGELARFFAYDPYASLPRNIFQTWKHGVEDDNFPSRYKGSVESWDEKNIEDGFRHYVFSDEIIDEWVRNEYSFVEEVLHAWELLPRMILKADFFRYLVIFARGGVYSDIDTFCLKKIKDWPIGNSGLVVGIEADPDREDWYEWYARRIQFVQWTIVGKKGHPFLRELIARIVEETLRRERLGTLNKIEGKDKGGDVMSWTGPGIFTDTLFDYLNNVISEGEYGDGFGIGSKYWVEGEKYKLKKQEIDENGLPLHAKDMKINYERFTGMREGISFDEGDILVLPITCFSPGVGQMGSKPPTDKMALVLHNFSGSWKPAEERIV